MGATATPITYSDIPKGATVVSAPQYSDLPAAAKLVPAGLSFEGQYDPQSKQWKDAAVNAPDAGVVAGIKRGISNIASIPGAVYHAIADAPTPEEQASGSTIAGMSGLPNQAGVAIHRLFVQPQVATWQKADQEKDQPSDTDLDNATERSHMHRIAALVPIVGPIADNLAQRWLSGDKSGAAAELATYIAAPKAAEAATDVAKPVAQATVRQAAKLGNTAIQNAPAIGATVGGIGGLVQHGAEGGIVGAYAGNRIGKFIQDKAPTIPGENYGLAPKYEPLPDAAGPQRAPVVGAPPIPKPTPPPEPGAAEEARAHFQQKLAARKAAQPTSTPEAPPALPSEDDVAKGIGYKNAAQAQQRLGPQQWQETYSKIAKPTGDTPEIATPAQAQQAVSDLIDKVAPGTPLKAKSEIDFQLRKGNVEQARQLLDDQEKTLQIDDRSAFDSDQAAINRYKSRLYRAGSSADANKGSLMSAQQAVESMPLPGATLEDNKLLGYEGRRTIAEATKARADAMQGDIDAPWGGAFRPYTEAVKQFIRLYYGEGAELKPRPRQP